MYGYKSSARRGISKDQSLIERRLAANKRNLAALVGRQRALVPVVAPGVHVISAPGYEGGTPKVEEGEKGNPTIEAAKQLAGNLNSAVNSGGTFGGYNDDRSMVVADPASEPVLFGNDGSSKLSVALSPDFGAVRMNKPVHVIYPSPTHFVEAMHILLSSQLGGSSRTCGVSMKSLPKIALEMDADVVRHISRSCEGDHDVKWREKSFAEGTYFYYLFQALWNKYKGNPGYTAELLNTGTRPLFLVVPDANRDYGAAISKMLMLIRTMLRSPKTRNIDVAGLPLGAWFGRLF